MGRNIVRDLEPTQSRRLKIGILTSHRIQYQAPFFRSLAEIADLYVFFAHEATGKDQAGAGFGVEFDWDVDLTSGYRSISLENVSRRPGIDGFFSCDTPSIIRIIRHGSFDAFVIYGWNLKTYWQAVYSCIRYGVPIFTRGDSNLETHRAKLVRIVKYPVYRLLAYCFDAFLSVGKRTTAYYKHYGIKDDKIYCVRHTVDVELFRALCREARKDKEGLRRAIGLDGERRCLSYVGKLIPLKRVQDVLACAAQLKIAGVDVQVLIVGDGPEKTKLQQYAGEHRISVVFSGFVNQSTLPRYYAASDIVILPSETETWGYVVNESFSCGVPVIVSESVGCAPDMVDDGETGYVYPTGDIQELSARVMDLLAKLREPTEIQKAISRKNKLYTPMIAADALVAGVKHVLARK